MRWGLELVCKICVKVIVYFYLINIVVLKILGFIIESVRINLFVSCV